MFIILEGVDGAGKTTIGKRLANLSRIPYVDPWEGKERPDIPGVNDFAEDLSIMDFCRQTGGSAILDRGILSGQVYRELSLYTEESALDPADFVKLWDYAPQQTALVLVTRQLELCRTDRFLVPVLREIDQSFRRWLNFVPDNIVCIQAPNVLSVEQTTNDIGKALRLW